MEQFNSQQQRWSQQQKKCTYLDEMIFDLKNGSNEEKSLAKILEYMKRASNIKQQNKNLLIIAGITGTGKTTFSAYISGLNLKVISESFGDDQECSLCYYENIYQMMYAIGMSNTESETLQPNFFQLNNETIIVDCPGLLDSRGVEVDISNSYCLSKAICYSQNIKFLITLDGQSFQQQIQDKGKSLKATLEAIFFLAQRTKIDFTKNVAILFTKTEEDEKFYKEKFDILINQLMKSPDFNYQNLKYCDQNKIQQYLQQLLFAKIILFPLPKEEEIGKQFSSSHLQSIISKINQIQFYQKNNNEKFYFQMTNQSLQMLAFIRDYSRQQVKQLFEEICQYLIQLFKNMNEQQLRQFPGIIKNYNKQHQIQQNRLNNRSFYDLLYTQLFLPIVNLQPYATNQQSYKKTLKKLKFFLGEVYDNLLSQFNFIKRQQDIKINFGVIDEYEISEGLLQLQQSYQNLINQVEKQKLQSQLQNQIYYNNFQKNDLKKQIQQAVNQIDSCKKQVNKLNYQADQLSREEQRKKDEKIQRQKEEEALKKQREEQQKQMLQSQKELSDSQSDLYRKIQELDKKSIEEDRYFSNQIESRRTYNNNTRQKETQQIQGETKRRSSPTFLGVLGSAITFAFIGARFGPIGAMIGGAVGIIKETVCSIF
ncbi:hypothetical protein ABPG74_000551 [Tetrahymena malaccensis]